MAHILRTSTETEYIKRIMKYLINKIKVVTASKSTISILLNTGCLKACHILDG